MTFRWSRDQIEKLISCIEQYPEVYNTKSKKYAEKNKRVEAFNAILEYIQQTVSPDITLYEIKRKWKNLRTQYTQELRTINQTKESESGMVDVYIPKLWCFRQLNFLQSHTEGRSKCHTEVWLCRIQKEIVSSV